MLKPQFKVNIDKQTDDFGRFFLEPLEQGYGQTLGNALRRCLLTHLEGAAVTEVKIDGVRHQFTTLEGLKEDIVELILNIKKLRIKYTSGKLDTKGVTLRLEAKGPGGVKASQIKTPAGIEIVNKDLVLAKLADKKSKLSMEMKVQPGIGYSPAEERKIETVGVVPVDALFNPVRRVNYKVEATRVGRRTDFDRLIIEIWTDGSTKPLQVLKQAAQSLVDYFKQVYAPVFEKVTEQTPKKATDEEFLNLTVEELDLPTRIVNALIKGGYKTVRDLAGAKRDAIASVKNLGTKSISVIEKKIKDKGLGFQE
jgi:DNA-directed RNA polymerase subunit alpha